MSAVPEHALWPARRPASAPALPGNVGDDAKESRKANGEQRAQLDYVPASDARLRLRRAYDLVLLAAARSLGWRDPTERATTFTTTPITSERTPQGRVE